MNPRCLEHRAKFKFTADGDGPYYHLLKLDHPTLTLWVLISEHGSHWCSAADTPLGAFGAWEEDFTFIQFDAVKSFDVSL